MALGSGGDIYGDTAMLAGGTLTSTPIPQEVYVYRRQGGQWTQTQTLTHPLPGSTFGTDLDIDGNDAIINSDNGVHLYENQSGVWVLVASFLNPDIPQTTTFGRKVRVSDGVAMAGDMWAGTAVAGKIHVWEKVGGVWTSAPPITPLAAEEFQFGENFDLDSGRLVVVVSVDPPVGPVYSMIHTFERGVSGWANVASQQAPATVAPLDAFGRSMGLSGDYLVAGAHGTDVTTLGVTHFNQGVVYIFERDGVSGAWVLVTTLIESDETFVNTDEFGRFVDVDGNRIAVGEREGKGSNDGGIKIFERVDGAWVGAGVLGDFGGLSMAMRLQGEDVIVASFDDQGPGYVYDVKSGLAVPYGTGCPGTHGLVPELSMDGCLVSGSSVTLGLTQGVLGATPILFVSASPASIPIGGGCSFLVNAVAFPVVLPTFSGFGQLGNSLNVGVTLPVTSMPIELYLHAFTPDAGSAIGYAASNGLRLRIDV